MILGIGSNLISESLRLQALALPDMVARHDLNPSGEPPLAQDVVIVSAPPGLSEAGQAVDE